MSTPVRIKITADAGAVVEEMRLLREKIDRVEDAMAMVELIGQGCGPALDGAMEAGWSTGGSRELEDSDQMLLKDGIPGGGEAEAIRRG
jgi:hypothetical protein